MLALRKAGVPRDHPALRRAVDWLLAEQIAGGGDWQVKVPLRDCGGWAFEFDNDIYPDVDDTAVVVLALLEFRGTGTGVDGRSQTRSAGAGPCVRATVHGRHSTRTTRASLVYKLPFADFGAMLDPPSEDVTAHVLEMLAGVGCGLDDPDIPKALAYLRAEQRPWGSWYGRWGVNHIYGTWCVVSALVALRAGDDMVRNAAAWILRVQNPDGGWGESCHSYVDEFVRRCGHEHSLADRVGDADAAAGGAG